MIRVLNILLDNRIGGPQNRVLSIGVELRKYGIDPIILAPKGDGDFCDKARKKSFRTFQIILLSPKYLTDVHSILENLKWIITFPISIILICRIINRENIDIVHLQGLLNFQAAIAAYIMRKKIVWHLVGSMYPRFLVVLLMPFVILLSNHIIIIANKMGDYYFQGRTISSKVSVIYGCVDAYKFSPSCISESHRDKLKKEFCISSSDRIIGCIGNINPAKGYEYLLDSINIIKKKHTNIKYIIIGKISDSQKQYFAKLLSIVNSQNLMDDVFFVGQRDDIPHMLSIFDIFILPSTTEGTPIAVLEAMSMEKLVVAADVGAVSEQIINGKTGFIIPPRDSEAIARCITSLLNNGNNLQEMGKSARVRVLEIFSLKQCVYKYIDLYQKVLKT